VLRLWKWQAAAACPRASLAATSIGGVVYVVGGYGGIATQTLSEFFDLAASYVGVEGVNQRKLVTQRGLGDALSREDVQGKIFQNRLVQLSKTWKLKRCRRRSGMLAQRGWTSRS